MIIMSGGEATLIVRMIPSVITLIKSLEKSFEEVKNAQELPEALRKVAENLPLILATLWEAEQFQKKVAKDYNKTSDAARK